MRAGKSGENLNPHESETPKPFRFEFCKECGTCFSLCPVLSFPIEKAQGEIRKVKFGGSSPVLSKCTGCMDCDFFCPEGANPAELILSRWRNINLERNPLIRANYFLPHSRPNFRSYVIERMGKRERKIIESWKDMSPSKHICYPGCNMIATPLLTQTKVLEKLDIRGSLDVCCGEMYWRMGLFDDVRTCAEKTTKFFQTLKAEKVTILCTAGYYMFTEVLPHFGGGYPFEIESYLEFLDREISASEIEFQRTLPMKVTIQESCYGKQFGHEYMDIPRKILKSAGCQIVEMENSGEKMLCCGIGAGFSPASAYDPIRMTLAAMRVLRQARKTGADALVVYCSGCLQMLSTARILLPQSPPIYHILEIIELATGGNPEKSSRKSGFTMLSGVVRNQFPLLLSRKRLPV
ncbi:MAG: (Fe-S)-binding protein [Actinomycetota bacterium]|nr:(Fe-S)-binding protein [Actinomycetota bacterium]